jgi:hypothetical protein
MVWVLGSIAIMDSPQPEPTKSHNLGDSLAILTLVIALLCWAFVPTIIGKALAVAASVAILVYLAYKSHFTRNFSRVQQHIMAGLIAFGLIVFATIQLHKEWKAAHPDLIAKSAPQSPPLSPQKSDAPPQQPLPVPRQPTTTPANSRVAKVAVTEPPKPARIPTAPPPNPSAPPVSVTVEGGVKQGGDGDCQANAIGGSATVGDNCYGNPKQIGPGLTVTILLMKPSMDWMNQARDLNNSRKYAALLAHAREGIKNFPEWLTPYLFGSVAALNTGDVETARQMLSAYDKSRGQAYDEGDGERLADGLRATLGMETKQP